MSTNCLTDRVRGLQSPGMLKRAFSIAALVGLNGSVLLTGIELGRTLLADEIVAHIHPGMPEAPRQPARPEILARMLASVHIAALVPDCETTPQADPALCAWIAYDEQRIESAGKRPPAYGPFTTAAQGNFEHMRAYAPPESYRLWDEERTAEAIDAIINDPQIIEYISLIKKQNRYQDQEEALFQAEIKQKLLQRTSDLLRAAYGLDPIPVALRRFDEDVRYSAAGFYNPHSPSILINYEIMIGKTDSYVSMLSTILHETRHSIDSDFAYMLLTGQMEPDDVRAPHAAAMLLNSKEYISYDDAGMIQTGLFENAYRLQYTERSAFAYGNEVAARIISDMFCKNIGLTCARAQISYRLYF